MCMEARPPACVLLAGGKAVFPFPDLLRGDALFAHISWGRGGGVLVSREEPVAGWALSPAPGPALGRWAGAYRPSLPLACFLNPPLRSPPTVPFAPQIGHHQPLGRAGAQHPGSPAHEGAPCCTGRAGPAVSFPSCGRQGPRDLARLPLGPRIRKSRPRSGFLRTFLRAGGVCRSSASRQLFWSPGPLGPALPAGLAPLLRNWVQLRGWAAPGSRPWRGGAEPRAIPVLRRRVFQMGELWAERQRSAVLREPLVWLQEPRGFSGRGSRALLLARGRACVTGGRCLSRETAVCKVSLTPPSLPSPRQAEFPPPRGFLCPLPLGLGVRGWGWGEEMVPELEERVTSKRPPYFPDFLRFARLPR